MLYFYIEYPDYTYYFDVELTDGTDDQGNATHTYTIVGYEYQVNYYSLQYFTYVNQYGDTDDYWGKMHIGLDYDEKLEIQKAYLYYFQFGPYSSCYGYDLDFYDSDELEYDENGNVYSVALVDEDGQVYTLYLALDHEYGLYSIAALVKEAHEKLRKE